MSQPIRPKSASVSAIAMRCFGLFGLPISVRLLQASVIEVCLTLPLALLGNVALTASLTLLGLSMAGVVLAMHLPFSDIESLVGATSNAYFGPLRGGAFYMVLILTGTVLAAGVGRLIPLERSKGIAKPARIALACIWPLILLAVPFGLHSWPAAVSWALVMIALQWSMQGQSPANPRPEWWTVPSATSAHNTRRDIILLFVLTIVLLLPFAWKPFHIDDPAYLETAQQITRAPLDFYRFDAYTTTGPVPMWKEMQNPPGFSYFLAAAGTIFGWRELPMHAVEIAFAVIAILGTYFLARRFCTTAWAPAVAMLVTPAFYVSSTSVMCDVPMLAFYLWAAVCWLQGYDRPRHTLLIAGAALVAAATLTKYFGMTLIPLLFVYSVVRSRGMRAHQLYLLIPVAILAAYEFWTRDLYGRGLLLGAGDYANTVRDPNGKGSAVAVLSGILFIGGGMGTVAFVTLAQLPANALARAAVFSAIASIGIGAALGAALPELNGINEPLAGLFVCAAIGIIVIAVRDLFRAADACATFLVLWFFGTLAFAVTMNWSVTMRALLPAAPVAAIFVVRALENRWGPLQIQHAPFRFATALGLALLPSLVIAASDARFAASDRDLATTIHRESQDVDTLKFDGLWGFAWYMREFGAVPLRVESIQPGDHVALSEYDSPFDSLDGRPHRMLREFDVDRGGVVRTMFAGAGFYSSLFGPMPYAIGPAPPNRYVLYLVTDSAPVANAR